MSQEGWVVVLLSGFAFRVADLRNLNCAAFGSGKSPTKVELQRYRARFAAAMQDDCEKVRRERPGIGSRSGGGTKTERTLLD